MDFFCHLRTNLFLNWTIFVPLIAAFLLVPRILAALTQAYAIHNRDGSLGWPVLLIGIVAGCFSIAFVVNKLPSKNFDDAQTRYDRDASVLVLGVLPLVIFAFCATTYWTGVVEAGEATTVDLWLFHLPFEYKILNFMVLSVSIYLFGYIGYGIWRVFWWLLDRNNKFDSRPKYVSIFSGLLATIAGGAVLWLAARLVSDYGFFKDAIATGHDAEYYVCLAVPVFMLVFLIQSTLYVGLSSKDATDDDREWFARFGGWIFIVGIAWLAVNGFVLLWPYFLKFVVSRAEGWYKIVPPVIASVITVVSGLISLVGGFSSKLPQKQDCNVNRRTKLISMLPQIASACFYRHDRYRSVLMDRPLSFRP